MTEISLNVRAIPSMPRATAMIVSPDPDRPIPPGCSAADMLNELIRLAKAGRVMMIKDLGGEK